MPKSPPESTDAPEAPASVATEVRVESPTPDSATSERNVEVAELRKEIERVRREAANYRTKARENADAASKAKTVEEQLAELHKAMADRDVADVQRNGRLALTQVQTRLAETGLSRDDVSGLLDLVDPTSLLSDGEPDEKAIDKLATSLTKIAGRTTPDRDQGRRGGDGPADMNTLIRRAAGINT